ncbi:MAG TPA: serine/threonine-protein kinase [Gemmatimonadaceae bacterium]|jgi:serine/threonine-protein kinase|nr:serine/threonine-protein kinase [Gemmatimonadaceae bacterium]
MNESLEYKGSFHLIRKVADGGMATVYEAEQLGPAGFAKRIALKVIHPHLAERSEFLRMFVDEARLSANLMHGNIVQIYQLGEVNSQYFIAMEYIQGPTLRSVVDRHNELGRPIAATMVAYIGSRLCRALDFAHNAVGPDGKRLDVVHRDVSPGNVMITWDGHVKLGDFGIAKARTSFDPASEHHVRMGKKRYMSPEQVLGTVVDARSDVFSLGVVLYELLALSPLFHEDDTALSVEEVVLRPLPDLRSRVTDLDPELADILQLALQRNPAERATAAQLGRLLDRWVSAQGERDGASPDQVQAHLAEMFPTTFQERFQTVSGHTPATVDAFRKKRGSIIARLFG